MVKLINTLFGIIIVWMISISVYANIVNCTSVYEVTANQLNIRNKANTTGKIIGTYKHGDKVCINSESGNWGETDEGWVSKKHLISVDHIYANDVQAVKKINSSTTGDESVLMIIIGIIIILAIIFFALKTLFYHSLISFGLAEPDGRVKNGIRLTRLGKFLSSISGLILFFLFLWIGSLSK